MIEKTANSYPISIFIAGDVNKAADSLRRQCFGKGLCVTLTPTEFIYTAGAEAGVEVGIRNYPRFPKEPAELVERAREVTLALLDDLYQHSAMIQTPTETIWLTRRPEDLKVAK